MAAATPSPHGKRERFGLSSGRSSSWLLLSAATAGAGWRGSVALIGAGLLTSLVVGASVASAAGVTTLVTAAASLASAGGASGAGCAASTAGARPSKV